MSRKRLIYLGLAVLAAVGFLIDRVFLGEPTPALAGEASGRAPKAGRVASKPAGEVLPSDPSIARLDRIVESHASRDVFKPSDRMIEEYKARQLASEQAVSPDQGPKPGTAEAFVADHHLKATVSSSSGAMAIVDSRPLRVGDQMDGFTLRHVGRDSAEFRRGDEKVILSLPLPGERR